MLSPFPGMDPFIESQEWQTFHTRAVVAIADQLVPLVRHRYVVGVERSVYLSTESGERGDSFAPDVSIFRGEQFRPVTASGVATITQPTRLQTPMHEPIEEHYIVLRKRDDRRTVTAIELLSPTNKSPSDGLGEYLAKRSNLMRSDANVVEIDLLRGGRRLPTTAPLPTADYYAFISRAGHRPDVDVYSWMLEERMPRIPIPLAEGDADVAIDLQLMLDTVYDRGGVDDSVDYSKRVLPRLTQAQTDWVQACLISHEKQLGAR